MQGLASFIAVAIPAACVNSSLKFFQKLIQLNFMRNLTHHLHRKYCSNRAYYAASVLRGLSATFALLHAPQISRRTDPQEHRVINKRVAFCSSFWGNVTVSCMIERAWTAATSLGGRATEICKSEHAFQIQTVVPLIRCKVGVKPVFRCPSG